jgi:hypothetical protein
LPPDIEPRRHGGERVTACALPVANLPFEDGDAVEPVFGDPAEQRERHHAGDPSVGDAFETLRNEDTASRRDRDGDHQKRHGRRLFMLDMDAAVRRDPLLEAAERVRADRMVHCNRPRSS